LWKGSAWQQRTGHADSRVNIGWMHAIQDQVVALADFSARNDLAIQSADDHYARWFGRSPEHAVDMRAIAGEEFFSTTAHWAFLSLNGKAGPFHFPSIPERQPFTRVASVIVEDHSVPVAVTTKPQAWAYADVLSWHPSAPVPAAGQSYLRLRLHVDGASIGVGLLGADGTEFTVRRVLAPAAGQIEMLLPVAEPARPGKLVIQTWADPATARVRLDDLSIVW
jgi:hypothetical protein